jgi:hypothetical protein
LDPHFAKPATGSTPIPAKLGTSQETDGPAVPRTWYPVMPHQGG